MMLMRNMRKRNLNEMWKMNLPKITPRGCSLFAFVLGWIVAASVAVAQEAQLRPLLIPDAGAGRIQLHKPLHQRDLLQQLELERGKSIAVATEYPVKRVSVGDPEILDVVILSPRELQFVAKAVGVTNVLLWDTGNRPQAVIDVHVGTAYTQVASALQRVVGDYPIDVASVGNSVALRGLVPNALAMEHALEVARALLPAETRDRVINLMQIGGGQQVMLEVVIGEMSRQVKRSLGTNFHNVIESDGTTFEIFNFLNNLVSIDERSFAFDLSSFELTELETLLAVSESVTLAGSGFGIGSGLYEFFFEVLERNGLGKVLAEPTLVARSGEHASFLVGGEVPIPVAQGGAFGSITIEYKDFGVGLGFTPTVLDSDRIHLIVRPEVSQPNFALGTAVGGTTIPAFDTRRASTTIELGDGQSFAIAGLLSERMSDFAEKYPVLGDIPVLGGLFRSSSYQNEETELVMIVTPRIVKPLPLGPRPLPSDHFIAPSAFEFFLLGRLEARAEAVPPPAEPEAGVTPKYGGMIGPVGHRVLTEIREERK
jgi:pilus assembly protein CpaC